MTKQNNALRLADELDAVPETGADPQTIQEAAAELRRQHARIAELEARIKTMAEEHADELMVAHLDGRVRAAQPAGAQQPGVATWTPLPGTLPEPGKPVLLDIGMEYPIRAMWAAKHALEVGMEDDSGFGEYDEATDTYYCPEGWYEWNEHEETHWAVDETPTAWCELPPNGGASHGQAPAQAAPVCGSPADLPPLPDPDLRDVGTNPEDIKEFLRGYATEYALTALTARAPADSVQDLQPVHDAVTIDLLNERVAYLERKLQEADSVLEDAARYRWLRQHDGVDCTDDGEFIAGALSGITIGIDASRAQGIDGADLDTAIDAARAAQEGK